MIIDLSCDKTCDLIKARDAAKAKYKRKPNQENKTIWKNLNKQIDESYVNDDINYLEGMMYQMKIAAESNRLRTTWRLVNEISGKKNNSGLSKI